MTPDLVEDNSFTREIQINPRTKHMEVQPMDYKRTIETEREKVLMQQKHIERIRTILQLVNQLYGGMVIGDYELRKIGDLEPITYLDERVVISQNLTQRLSVPTTFIYAIERDGIVQPIITLFHQKYVNPIHVFINEDNQITRTATNRGDVRNLNDSHIDNLKDFFADYPLDYVQDNQLIVQSIQALRIEMGF